MGIDPGWGSSAFGLVLLQVPNGRIEVMFADEFQIPRYEDTSRKVIDLSRGLNRRNIDQEYLDSCKSYVDAANSELLLH